MKEKEAFEKLVAVVDFAVKNLSAFGIRETKEINTALDVLSSKLIYAETLENTMIHKDEFIEKNIMQHSGNETTLLNDLKDENITS